MNINRIQGMNAYTANGRILVICVLWRNAEGDLKDK